MVHAKFIRQASEPLWYDIPEVLPAFHLMDPQPINPANDQVRAPEPPKSRHYRVRCVMRSIHGFKEVAQYARYEES